MSAVKQPFKNQRPGFRNPSPPYREKTLDNPRWLFPSRKNGRQVHCWTVGEFRAAKAFEAAFPELLISYEERPELVRLRDGPEWYRYTPSFRVDLATGPVILELSHLGQPRTLHQMVVARLAEQYYARRGVHFVQMAHSKLRAQPRAAGVDLLIRYLSAEPTQSEILLARDAVANGPISVARVEVASRVRREHLMAMVRLGDLALVTPPPIGLDSLLALPSAGGRS